MKSMTRTMLIAAVIGAAMYRSPEVGAESGTKTAEQIAAEQAAAKQADDARKAAEAQATTAARKEAEKAAKAAQKEAERAEKAAKAEAEKKAKAEKVAADKKAREDEKARKLAEKEAKKQAQEAAKQTSKLPTQNDVTRPKPDTITGSVWAAADEISQAKGSWATIGEVSAKLPSVADATIKTQYARWRKFNGVTGRLISAAAPAADAASVPTPPVTGQVPVPPAPNGVPVPPAPQN